MRFITKYFQELTLHELYSILKLRAQVFVVEQECPYQDLDDKDQDAFHVFSLDEEGEVIAYTRLLAKGVSYDKHCSIGRVVINQSIRDKGAGKKLMTFSIDTIKQLYPEVPIKISAQLHLKGWYANIGFTAIGESYLEDNIPHIAMTLDYLKK